MSFPGSPRIHYYLTVVTLLDQLDQKEFNWQQVSILQGQSLPASSFRGIGNIEFCQIVSKFLMDRDRAGLFWVSSQMYANLAMHLLKLLCDR
jgi:hypothetical protein